MGKGGNHTTTSSLGVTNHPNNDTDKVTITSSTDTTSTNSTSLPKLPNTIHDYYWSPNETEPHSIRRKLILQQYPEIKSLYGYCPYTKYKVCGVVLIQLSIAYIFRNQFTNIVNSFISSSNETSSSDSTSTTTSTATVYPWYIFWLVTYMIGGTCNHMCMMAIHELSHNLGFATIKYNKYFAICIANVPITIPSAITFKRYHIDHHNYQGYDMIDVDIPTVLEGQFFTTTLRKLFFVIFQVAFYGLRPSFVHPKSLSTDEIFNILYILCTNVCIVVTMGYSSVLYLLLSSWLGMGLHPVAGHFIAEHYIIPYNNVHVPATYINYIQSSSSNTNTTTTTTTIDHVPETYSYYGLCNYFTFNVGYHNEHHDFPFIPGSRLPKVKDIAGSQFYNHLPYHTSYINVFIQYIFNSNITGFSRVKRNPISSSSSNTNTSNNKTPTTGSCTSTSTTMISTDDTTILPTTDDDDNHDITTTTTNKKTL